MFNNIVLRKKMDEHVDPIHSALSVDTGYMNIHDICSAHNVDHDAADVMKSLGLLLTTDDVAVREMFSSEAFADITSVAHAFRSATPILISMCQHCSQLTRRLVDHVKSRIPFTDFINRLVDTQDKIDISQLNIFFYKYNDAQTIVHGMHTLTNRLLAMIDDPTQTLSDEDLAPLGISRIQGRWLLYNDKVKRPIHSKWFSTNTVDQFVSITQQFETLSGQYGSAINLSKSIDKHISQLNDRVRKVNVNYASKERILETADILNKSTKHYTDILNGLELVSAHDRMMSTLITDAWKNVLQTTKLKG